MEKYNPGSGKMEGSSDGGENFCRVIKANESRRIIYIYLNLYLKLNLYNCINLI